MSVDWSVIRNEFHALKKWTYVNSATFGQMPRRATEAVAAHFHQRDEMACGDFLNWYDDMDRLRGKVAQLIRCAPQDVAFVTNAAAALSPLIAGIDWRPGDQILTLEHEYPNNLYASGALAGIGVELIESSWERFYDSVNARTRLVAISSANYNTGFAPPLEEVSKFLRARNVLLFVDGTQSVGAFRFDTGRIQPDVLAVHGYKWMISPSGAGFMYVRPEVRVWLRPNTIGWRSHHDWRNVDNLHHGVPEFTADAEKYEGGGLPFPSLYGMEASIDMMLEIGPDVIEQRVRELTQKTRDVLRSLGASIEDYDSSIVAAHFEGRDVSVLARSLRENHVLVAARRGRLRVSPHFYNNEQDLQVLKSALEKL